MNVFVLCAGRCGSVTLSKACKHISNFTSGHESTAGLHVDKRFEFPDNHIEVDNRLAWMLGRLDEEYGDSALYVYLTRNTNATAQSYNRRWDKDMSVVKAYTHGILMRDSEGLDDCIDYVKTLDSNVRHFLKDKTRVLEIQLESLEDGLRALWDEIGAVGDIEAALAEIRISHNASKPDGKPGKPPMGGNHSFISRKQLSILRDIDKSASDQKAVSKTIQTELTEIKGAILDNLTRQVNEKNRQAEAAKRELKHERAKLKRLQSSFKYYVGDAFCRGLGNGRFTALRLPLAMIYAVKGVVNYRNLNKSQATHLQKERPLHDSIDPINEVRKKSHWPEPNKMKTDLAFQAMKVMQANGVGEAKVFFEAHMAEEHAAVRNIFHANTVLSDDRQWLKAVNRYFESFNATPIDLYAKGETAGPDFLRIKSAEKLEKVVDSDCKVSVIMPAYNAEKTITHAANSILDQTWENLELIIVDDCSDDNTWNIIMELADKDGRVVPLRNKANVGPYVSKNIALKFTTGRYITGHDADDWAMPRRIEQQVKIMLEDTRLKVGIARMIRMTEDRLVDRFARIGKTSPDGLARVASISCIFERESFLKCLGAWDCVRFGGDSELIARAEKVFGDQFVTQEVISMICLDAEGSLTNHPVHGVSRVTGISSSREEYRAAWQRWHEVTPAQDARLEFPQRERKFSVPAAATVENRAVEANLSFRDDEKSPA